MQFSRRSILTAFGASALVSTSIFAPVRAATSTTLNVLCWDEYPTDTSFDEFAAQTGLTLRVDRVGSVSDMVKALQVQSDSPYDMAFLPISTFNMVSKAVGLKTLDISKVANLSGVDPSIMDRMKMISGNPDINSKMVPFTWGAEAILTRNTSDQPISYDVLWSDAFAGQSTFRAKSLLVGIGLYLNSTGAIANPNLDGLYESEDALVSYLLQYQEFGMDHATRLGAEWKSGKEAAAAFDAPETSTGLVWDGTAARVMAKHADLTFHLPAEGGMAWLDGMFVPSTGQNDAAALELMDFLLTEEVQKRHIESSNYGSVMSNLLSKPSRLWPNGLNSDSIANVWWWRAGPSWWGPTLGRMGTNFSVAPQS